MVPEDSKKHHYIPEFYSRWWCGPDKRLERYTKPFANKLDVKRVYPSEVGWQRHLYSFPDNSEGNIQRLETRFFKQVDNLAAKVLKNLNGEVINHLTDKDTTSWSIFVQSIWHRTPENLEATKQGGRRILLKSLPELERVYDSIRSSHDPGKFEDYISQEESVNTEKIILEFLPSLILNPKIASFINNMHWIIRDVPPSCFSLLLSDDPIARTNGFMTENGHFAMPISPRKLFIAAWKKQTLYSMDKIPINRLVRGMNMWAVQGARHFVGAIDRSQESFISNHFGCDPKPGMARAVK